MQGQRTQHRPRGHLQPVEAAAALVEVGGQHADGDGTAGERLLKLRPGRIGHLDQLVDLSHP